MTRMRRFYYPCGLALAHLLSAGCSTRRPFADGGLSGRILAADGVLQLTITYTEAYCGGAYPGPEGMPRPQPWAGPMFLRKATPDSTGRFARNDLTTPVVDTIRTDRSGTAQLTLPTGAYLLLDQEHVDDRRYKQLLKDHARPAMHTDPIDQECLERWLFGPFGTLTIKSADTTRVALQFFGQCPWNSTPCVSYHGPLPP